MSEDPSAFAAVRRADVVRVLEEDPGLGEGLDGPSLEHAARVTARSLALARGRWDVPEPRDESGLLGLRVLDGLLVPEVTVGRRALLRAAGSR